MNGSSIKWISRLVLLLSLACLEACAQDPTTSLASHPQLQRQILKIGVLSNLGDTITYTRSNGWTSGSSQGDISTWNIDAAVVDTVTRSVAPSRKVATLRPPPKAFDDLAEVTMATALSNPTCASFMGGDYCNSYENPMLTASADPVALQARVRSILEGRAGEADIWIIFRKGAGAEASSDKSAAQVLSLKAPTQRTGITIAEIPGSGLGFFNKVMLQILGRVTIVDGTTLEPLADVPLSILPPDASNLLQPKKVTPFIFLKKEYLVDGWNKYTPEEREAIRLTVNQLLADAVIETLKEAGLLNSSSSGQAPAQQSGDSDGSH